MTQQRRDVNGSTEFGLWLRKENEIDSTHGFQCTDIDYIWRDNNTGEWILIEEKRYGHKMSHCQSELYSLLTKSIVHEKFKGFYLITFERTCPDDGKIWINGVESSKETLLLVLRFNKELLSKKWKEVFGCSYCQ